MLATETFKGLLISQTLNANDVFKFAGYFKMCVKVNCRMFLTYKRL